MKCGECSELDRSVCKCVRYLLDDSLTLCVASNLHSLMSLSLILYLSRSFVAYSALHRLGQNFKVPSAGRVKPFLIFQHLVFHATLFLCRPLYIYRRHSSLCGSQAESERSQREMRVSCCKSTLQVKCAPVLESLTVKSNRSKTNNWLKVDYMDLKIVLGAVNYLLYGDRICFPQPYTYTCRHHIFLLPSGPAHLI